MGGLLSGIFGTNSAVPVGPQQQLDLSNYQPLMQQGQGQVGQVNQGENALAQALIAQQQGGGPNPAAQMLTEAQGQNAQQAAGVYANNRAINPALAARQASNLQAQTSQQAANQAAIIRAQQQLAAQSQLGGLYGQQGQQGLGLTSLGIQGQTGQNQAINSGNAINAGVAAGNAANAAGLAGGLLQGAGSLGAAAIGANGKAHGGIIEPSIASYLMGGLVPGKAKVKGDSEENDIVPGMLSPGEIVVPRTASKNPDKAKQFIDHIMQKQGTDGGYGGMMAKHRALSSRIDALEKEMGKKAKK